MCYCSRETKQWVAKEGNVEEVLKQCQKRNFLLELWPLDEGSLEKSLLAIQLFTKLRERLKCLKEKVVMIFQLSQLSFMKFYTA